MKIVEAEAVIRFRVRFEEAEVVRLRETKLLPPFCAVPAFLWLTLSELLDTMGMLGYTDEEKEQFARKLEDKVQ